MTASHPRPTHEHGEPHGHIGHHHDHDHHDHLHGQSRGRLTISLGLAASYMATEVVGGRWTGSLALLADAGHMLSDVAALALALGAMALSRRPPTQRRTFGYHRAEVLAALFNGVALVGIALIVIREAVERWDAPPDVLAGPMMSVAAGGLVVNLVAIAVLHGGVGESLNVRGAFLHVVADALGSIGALVSGALIYFLGWTWADPVASAIIALLVLGSALMLLKQTVRVLMQGTSPRLDLAQVRAAMVRAPGVEEVHDLHAWTLTTGKDLLTAHVVVAEIDCWPEVLSALTSTLVEEHGIGHVTLQPELRSSTPCGCAFDLGAVPSSRPTPTD